MNLFNVIFEIEKGNKTLYYGVLNDKFIILTMLFYIQDYLF